MTIQSTFKTISRRLLFVQRRMWGESSNNEQTKEINRKIGELRDLVDNYFGPKIAREITYEGGEK